MKSLCLYCVSTIVHFEIYETLMGQSASTLPDYAPEAFRDDTVLDLNPFNYANGGNYTLEECPLEELAAKPMKEQMRFSDAITRRYALNASFRDRQKESYLLIHAMGKDDILERLNETSIGNMAFMAYHNPNSLWSTTYDRVIRQLTH